MKTKTICFILILLFAKVSLGQQELENTQKLTSPLIPSADALKMLQLPVGFEATLFAAEPEIVQPIAITTDAKGRIWIAECVTYAESQRNFDLKYNDRILIFEDTDGDGIADHRKVFWEGGKRLTSIEVGYGGVWVTAAPNMMFIPDRDGDDQPDGEPEILLDGWNDDFVRHNMVNGLKWGPDGWLYGRHGIQATSLVGPPDSTPSQRIALNCSIWRYHPVTREFEVVCEGTTNPWGHDWDEHGELFMINTVIGHFWHVIPGARFRRMYGSHFNPYTYEPIEQTADHFHFSGKEKWHEVNKLGITDETDKLGGGHAHCGLLIYQGDNWPDEYRGDVFTANFHGRRLNRETLERQGNGYVARHAPDFMKSDDLWFRGVELLTGPDGGVFLLDWSDIGECHENDGIHRTSGRIYKLTYGKDVEEKPIDLSACTTSELLDFLDHPNQWYPRTARRIMWERAAANQKIDNQLIELVETRLRNEVSSEGVNHILQTIWLVNGLSKINAGYQFELDDLESHKNEHVRAWYLRFVLEHYPENRIYEIVERMLKTESSGLVRLYMATSISKLPRHAAIRVAMRLSGFEEDADDRSQSKLIWYHLEPHIASDYAIGLTMIGYSRLPHLSKCIVRRVAALVDTDPTVPNRLVRWAKQSPTNSKMILSAMVETWTGRSKIQEPENWEQLKKELIETSESDVTEQVAFLGTIFGEGSSVDQLRKIATDGSRDPSVRRQAIKALGEAKPEGLFEILRGLIRDRSVALQVVKSFSNCQQPDVAKLILNATGTFDPETERAAISTLTLRKPWAKSLLLAVKNGRISKDKITAFHARQIQSVQDDELNELLKVNWGVIRETSEQLKGTHDRVAKLLERSDIAPDLTNGGKLFQTNCASCHVLFGSGGKRGPDLTGSNRNNTAYLLDNIIDPSSSVADTYQSTILKMEDGQTLVGVVTEETEKTLKLLMVEQEKLIEKDQIEARRNTNKSLMPDGLLDNLSDQEIVDLIGYLRK